MLERLKAAFHAKEKGDLRTLFTDPPVCFSVEYPGVPKPESRLSLGLLAAEWVLGDLRGEDMVEVAADLLERGLDTPSIRRLAGETQAAGRADVEDTVHRMFVELSTPYPLSETEARLTYFRQVAREVIHGERNAWAAADHLVFRPWPRKYENPDIYALCLILDSLDLDGNRVFRGTLEALAEELIQTFARMGAMTDGEKRLIHLGALEGEGWIAEDFDGPLPPEIQAAFEGDGADPF